MSKTPLIYNLFPNYFKSIDEWQGLLPHVASMGFNHIFINPFHETGCSGSIYSVRDYFRLNHRFLGQNQDPSDWSPLRSFIEKCRQAGVAVLMDLVINHTAIDSPLIRTCPQWYKRDANGTIMNPFAVDPSDSSRVTVWRDLAWIDYENTADRQGLLEYFDRVTGFFQETGITGFRCDAAYQVPPDIWEFLISRAKKRDRSAKFFAETLGCRQEQIIPLKGKGFDYLFNSSKWWNFDQAWCLQQHEENRQIAPSISFPESHDTERLAQESRGSVMIHKLRYVFASVFSEGILMPLGFEYGLRRKMDVVLGSADDFKEEHLWDLTDWIASVNSLKLSVPVLSQEGRWQALSGYDEDVFVMEKFSEKDDPPIIFCVNKTSQERQVRCDGYGATIQAYVRPCRDDFQTCRDVPAQLTLMPYEAVILFVA